MTKKKEPDRQKGAERRDRQAKRSREHSHAVSDIGKIPDCVDRTRRDSCRLDLKRFLTVYFPGTTGLSPFSADHDRVIARIQTAILDGGRRVNACYRGFAKSTITENSALWATLYGHRRFIPIIGADSTSATNNLESIKLELTENDLLYEDFPEICHAIRALEGRPQRRLSQSWTDAAGAQHLTYIEWNSAQIRFPSIVHPDAVGAGAVICTRGIGAGYRGLKVKMADGTQQRPDFIFLDDPQTDDTASSPLQIGKTLSTVRKAILKLGGHRTALAVVCNATVIQPDDAIDQLLDDPSWQGERIPMVRHWPEVHKTLWLEKYAEIRRTYDKESTEDQQRAHAAATEFYKANRGAMDAGGAVSWESCFDPEKEISAIQHAYNILIDDGEESFASECQNQPLRPEVTGPSIMSADQIARKVTAVSRGMAPTGSTCLTAFVDVHQEILVWCVAAWAADFTGSIISYGTFPQQKTRAWTVRNAEPTMLSVAPPGAGIEGAIRSAMATLTDDIAGRDWQSELGGTMKVQKLLIDSGYKPDIVFEVCRSSKHSAILLPARGFALGAKQKSFSEFVRQPGSGEKWGDNWYSTRVQHRQQWWVRFQTNYWKGFLHNRLSLAIGDRGALTLHAGSPEEHRLISEHLTAERPVRVTVPSTGRTVDEWLLIGGQDNHLLDCCVGAAVAASMLGVCLGGAEQQPPRKKYSIKELQKKAQAARAGP